MGPLRMVKVVVMGEGGDGKTTTIRHMLGHSNCMDPARIQRTKGMDIIPATLDQRGVAALADGQAVNGLERALQEALTSHRRASAQPLEMGAPNASVAVANVSHSVSHCIRSLCAALDMSDGCCSHRWDDRFSRSLKISSKEYQKVGT